MTVFLTQNSVVDRIHRLILMAFVCFFGFSAAPSVEADTHTYSLVSGAGDSDNSLFEIVGNQLKAKASLNYEDRVDHQYYVRIQTDDGNGGTYSEAFVITVTDANDPPTASNNTVSTNEDTDKVFAASEFNFSDEDSGDTLSQVQITSIPSAGTLYNDANTDGVVDGGEALSNDDVVTKAHIDANRLKFKPAANGNGSPYTTFDFKVHDGTEYSASSYTMTINVTSVQDAPTAANNTLSTNEDTDKTFAASEFNFSDVDTGDTLAQVQITAIPGTGTLFNDANTDGVVDGGEALSNDDVVPVADINNNQLKFGSSLNRVGRFGEGFPPSSRRYIAYVPIPTR